jgi:trigger factor
MEVTVAKLSPVLLELQIHVPADAVAEEVESAYDKLRRTANVRGFRRGKVPRNVLAHLYGRAIHADVARKLVDATLQRALRERDVQPLTQPDVEPAELDPKQPFAFKARFEVRPDIATVAWEGLTAARPRVEVTEAMVEEEIEEARQAHATLEPIEDRPADKGDHASLVLTFKLDGREQKEEVTTEIGSGELLPDVDGAIAGMQIGEEREVDVTFPQSHPRPELRNKKVPFRVRLEALRKRVLPDVDDELAKDCEHESLQAMREAVRGQIAKRLGDRAEEEVARRLVAALCERNPIPVPPSLVEQQMKVSEQEMRTLARMRGEPWAPGPDLAARVKADAEVKVRAGLLMAEIAKHKSIKVGEEDIERGCAELAEQTGKNVAKVKAEYRDPNKRQMLVGMILEDKVLDLLEQSATITEEST